MLALALLLKSNEVPNEMSQIAVAWRGRDKKRLESLCEEEKRKKIKGKTFSEFCYAINKTRHCVRMMIMYAMSFLSGPLTVFFFTACEAGHM